MTPLFNKGITLRSLLYYTAVSLCFCFVVGYTLFQARFLIAGPYVTLTNEAVSVQSERMVTIEGTAENIVRIALNGRAIYTDKDGHFKEALVLENGYTVATLQAHDRYGRSRTYTKQFVYTPQVTP